MNLPRPLKLAILALTLWPPLYMVAFFAILIAAPTTVPFSVLFTLHVATMAVQMGLLVFYLVHLFKSPSVDRDKRTLWGITLFLGAPIAMPIYWFTHVWPETDHGMIDP